MRWVEKWYSNPKSMSYDVPLDVSSRPVSGFSIVTRAYWSDSDGSKETASLRKKPTLKRLTLPQPVDGCDPAWHLYVIRHAHADALAAALGRAGIGSKRYYTVPLHRQLDQWELRRDGEPSHGSGSMVLPVRTSDGTPAVLKISFPDAASEHEHLVLQVQLVERLLVADPFDL